MTDSGQIDTGSHQSPDNSSRGRSVSSLFLGWLRDLFIAIALALVIIAFVYQPVKVEGTSMAPLLTDQERIFINKFVYEFEPIERGDVVVFRYPRDPRKSFIKRVVGLPGEMVEIRRGVVYVHGGGLREDYLGSTGQDSGSARTTVAPPGPYFVLGDHRRHPNDP